MDYIKREDVINAINGWDKQDVYPPAIYLMALEDIPAADVEEVIRCKECKYFDLKWGCEFLGDGRRVNKKGYCSFAERRG